MPAFSAIAANEQANAARYSADKQAKAARESNRMQERMYQQQRADAEPWRKAGTTALAGLQDPEFQRNFTMDDFKADPGYQFRMQQGQKALERSAAARGGLMSGGFARALNDYGQNMASNEFQNSYNRFNNDRTMRFNRLSSIAGLGQTSNNQMGQASQNYANQWGANTMGGAKAQGDAAQASANAWGGFWSGLGQNAMQGGMMLL